MTLEQVTSLIQGGGLPSDIAITNLGIGTAENGQLIGVHNGEIKGRNLSYDLMFYGGM
jgi:hypothetical protein